MLGNADLPGQRHRAMGDTLLWSSLSCWQGCREGGGHPTSLRDMGSIQPCCPQLLSHPPAPDQVWNRVAQTTGGSGTPLTLGWGRWGSPSGAGDTKQRQCTGARGEWDEPLGINRLLGRGRAGSSLAPWWQRVGKDGGQTHSCKERLQYKSIRGVPFLCICTMT